MLTRRNFIASLVGAVACLPVLARFRKPPAPSLPDPDDLRYDDYDSIFEPDVGSPLSERHAIDMAYYEGILWETPVSALRS